LHQIRFARSSRARYQVYLLENTNSLPSGSPNFAIVPPNLFLWFGRQLHTSGFENLCRGKNVVAEGHRLETANPVFMALGSEQPKRRICPRDEKFDPALPGPKGLIRSYLESNLLGLELQRNILVAHRNTDNLDAANHVASSRLLATYPAPLFDAIRYPMLY
jgi:hypothetical protein